MVQILQLFPESCMSGVLPASSESKANTNAEVTKSRKEIIPRGWRFLRMWSLICKENIICHTQVTFKRVCKFSNSCHRQMSRIYQMDIFSRWRVKKKFLTTDWTKTLFMRNEKSCTWQLRNSCNQRKKK